MRIAGEYKEAQYNFKDLAPMAVDEDDDLVEAKKRARPSEYIGDLCSGFSELSYFDPVL